MDSGKYITFLVDGEICQYRNHVLKWRDLDVFVKHGLIVQPGITIMPVLVYQCLYATISLYTYYFGLNPRSLQELCASTIQFNTLNKALLPHQLQKFCQDYLYDELNFGSSNGMQQYIYSHICITNWVKKKSVCDRFWFIKWDAAMQQCITN